jgi:hypothetical protein
MTPLGFLWARTLRQEAKLEALSSSPEELLAAVAGRSVALVGNARALTEGGAAIDAADLVIRINRAPMPQAQTHGTRTDMLALATSLPLRDLVRLRPGRILWMSPKRKRLTWGLARSPKFYLHPQRKIARLAEALGAPPSTGLMMIDLLARSEATQIDLWGFDFFASQSLSGSRTAAQVPHDFAAERGFVEHLCASDPRFRLHSAAGG